MLGFYFPRVLLAAAAVCLSSGCAGLFAAGSGTPAGISSSETGATSAVVANPSVFDYTTGSTKIEFLSPAAFLPDNPWIEQRVVHEQCYFKTPDPVFLVPNWNTPTWTFAGRLNKDSFQSLEYRSLLTLGLIDGDVQLNTWPLQLISLSDMPEAFLQQRLPLPAQAKMDAADQREVIQDDLRRAERIRGVIERLEKQYDPAKCVPHRKQ